MLPTSLFFDNQKQLWFDYLNRFIPEQEYKANHNLQPAIAWASSQNIRFAEVSLPKNLSADVKQQALKFETEESFIAQNEEFYFADLLTDKTSQIACVPIAEITQLCAVAKKNSVYLKAVYPDIFLLPWNVSTDSNSKTTEQENWRIFISPQYIIVRTGQWQGFSGNTDLLLDLIKYKVNSLKDKLDIQIFAENTMQIPDFLQQFTKKTISLPQLMRLTEPQGINLLQGALKPTSSFIRSIKNFSKDIKMVAVLATLMLASIALTNFKYHRDTQIINAQLTTQIKQYFPQENTNWQNYLRKHINYFNNVKRPNLPWQKFQTMLPYMQTCIKCKITQLDVAQNTISLTLLSNEKQKDLEQKATFAGLSVDVDKIDSSYIYKLKWEAKP